ncbi:uncharacterized protein LOC143518423 [Brachyhypopomus gauderio]|uniref:uncharacterized protein LOC143518423 n=1 Tax=Brachyhypopomus gauderio TaxID=698409 RepID=UPI00404341A0
MAASDFVELQRQEVRGFFTISDSENPANYNFLERFHNIRPDLTEVHTVEKCQLVLVFCHVSEVKTDIGNALKKLNTVAGSRPAVLVVLHPISDPGAILDSSKYVNRKDTITVDCLIFEDQTLMKCPRNEDMLTKFANQITAQAFIEREREQKKVFSIQNHTFPHAKEEMNTLDHYTAKQRSMMSRRKYFTMVTGTTPQCHVVILRKLREQRPDLQEVNTVGQCDVILVFCSADSRTGSDIDTLDALKLLDSQSVYG